MAALSPTIPPGTPVSLGNTSSEKRSSTAEMWSSTRTARVVSFAIPSPTGTRHSNRSLPRSSRRTVSSGRICHREEVVAPQDWMSWAARWLYRRITPWGSASTMGWLFTSRALCSRWSWLALPWSPTAVFRWSLIKVPSSVTASKYKGVFSWMRFCPSLVKEVSAATPTTWVSTRMQQRISMVAGQWFLKRQPMQEGISPGVLTSTLPLFITS